jgi:ATP-binding cassette subfamily B protein RaxB
MRWWNSVVNVTNAELTGEKLLLVAKSANTGIFAAQSLAVLCLGASAVLQQSFSIGMFVAFWAFKEQFNLRCGLLIDRLFEVRLLSVQVDRLSDIALASPDDRHSLLNCTPHIPEGTLLMKRVSFRYSAEGPWILQEIDFHVEPGECIAITGPSGVGKSTMVKLIAGLIYPDAGDILIGDSEVQARTARSPIAFVMQDDELLSGTIADNIHFFQTEPDLAAAVECARVACIHDEILRMPLGYDTSVGEMGHALSGGQKQRILLARALYRNPSILVLDEATSHLDIATEKAIATALGALQMTRIILAHRPDTLLIADRIFHCEDGRLRQVSHVQQV